MLLLFLLTLIHCRTVRYTEAVSVAGRSESSTTLSDATSDWSNAVGKCADSDVPYAYPLIEHDKATLDGIVISLTHQMMQSLFVVGLYKEDGMPLGWMDGTTTLPYRLCESKDFVPWDTNAYCAPYCGKCGFLVSTYDSNYKDFCFAFLKCEIPEFFIQEQHLLCQYQEHASTMSCPVGFQPGPLGDRCFSFNKDDHQSWLDAFCSSVYRGHQLAVYRNMIDFWWISHKLTGMTNVGLGAFIGATSLGNSEGNYTWIDGTPVPPFVNFCDKLNSNQCAVTMRDTENLRSKSFATCFDYINCPFYGTIPAVFEYTPNNHPKVPKEVLCAVAAEGVAKNKYQICQLLFELHSCK